MSRSLIDTNEIRDWYVSRFNTFENSLNGKKDIPFHEIRQSAIERFYELGFPGRRDEEWKYTDITPVLRHKFQMADKPVQVSARQIKPFLFKGLAENLMVFVNGRHSAELSNYSSSAKGLIVSSLADAMENKRDVVQQYLSKYAAYEKEVFIALNTAFTADGIFIYIPDNVVVEEPIHLLYLSDSGEASFFASPRNLIVGGKNSDVKIVETHYGLEENAYFNNVVTEVEAGENAKIDHVRIQDESINAYHIFALQVHQERDSNYSLVNIDMGGSLVRNNLSMALDAENCEGHIIGFYMGTGRQHIDNHTLIDHLKPNCMSNEYYKGILGGKAKGVFSGKIYVHRDAQKTNSFQENKALLLTEDAKINSKPQLEIFADDVKCSHGATVGQLDDEALFYLQSRGIPRQKAYSTLQYAFASDVFNYVSLEPVREKLDKMLLERFETL